MIIKKRIYFRKSTNEFVLEMLMILIDIPEKQNLKCF